MAVPSTDECSGRLAVELLPPGFTENEKGAGAYGNGLLVCVLLRKRKMERMPEPTEGKRELIVARRPWLRLSLVLPRLRLASSLAVHPFGHATSARSFFFPQLLTRSKT